MAARRVNYLFTLEDCYVAYKKVTKSNIKERLSKADFSKLFNTFFFELLFYNLDKGSEAILPMNLGSLFLIKYKSRKNVVDWIKTAKLGKRSYITNDHSGGYTYKLIYKKAKYCKYINFYKYRTGQALKRRLFNKIMSFSKLGKFYPAYFISTKL